MFASARGSGQCRRNKYLYWEHVLREQGATTVARVHFGWRAHDDHNNKLAEQAWIEMSHLTKAQVYS